MDYFLFNFSGVQFHYTMSQKILLFSKKVLDQLLSICYNCYCSDERAQKELLLRDGVMVAQVTLDHSVWVRVLVPEPNGAMVKRLRRRPLKAKSRVRFPLALPEVNADA